MFKYHPDPVFVLDRDCRLVGMNPAARAQSGRAPEELRGRTIDAIAAPERVEPDLAHFRAVLAGETRVFDSAGIDHDNRRFFVRITAIPRVVGGRTEGVYVIARDIDADRRDRDRLAASEARLRAVIEHSMDAIFLSCPVEGRLLQCNRAAEKLFGRSEEELRQARREEVFDVAEPAFAEFIRQREAQGHARGVLHIYRPDGTRVPVEASTVVFREGDQWRSSVILRDITERERHEMELAASEARYRALFEQSIDAILLSRPDGTIDQANPAAERLFGYSEEELCRLGRAGLIDESDPDWQALREKRRHAGRVRGEIRLRRAGGESFLAEISIVGFRDSTGQERTSVVIRDITEHRELQRQLKLVAAAFQSADEALLICDADFRILDANDAYVSMAGIGREDLVGTRPGFLDIGDQAERIRQQLARDRQWRGELLQPASDGAVITTRAGISRITGSDRQARFLVINMRDVSQERRAQRKIDFLSYNDSLTGLPNLRALYQWFERFAWHDDDESGPGMALLYLDLDRFKAINESFGHSVGDDLLVEVAERLRSACDRRDYVVRLGGDDFLVALVDVSEPRQAAHRAEQLLDRIARPIRIEQRTFYSTASCGLAMYPEDGSELEDLLSRADAAHAAAKRRGRQQVQVYDSTMQRDVEEHALVETQLRQALRSDELDLVYQPVVDLADGRIRGFEALARWHNEVLGEVPPGRFIPVAEESGLILELGAWIFDRACARARSWLDDGLAFGEIAINISPAQFQQADFVDMVGSALETHGVDGRYVSLEITETVLMLDPEHAVALLGQLRDLGIRIVIDDFGTGYSSMAYLRRFPVDTIKLDQTFVAQLPASPVDTVIARSIISLAEALELGLVAEGVETPAQRDLLVEWGCRKGQGFLFSRPLTARRVDELLRSDSVLPCPGNDGSS